MKVIAELEIEPFIPGTFDNKTLMVLAYALMHYPEVRSVSMQYEGENKGKVYLGRKKGSRR